MAGTRPEAIKVAPVVKYFREYTDSTVLLCNSGQHKEMIQQIFSDFALTPDFSFDIMEHNQTLANLSSQLFAVIDPLLERENPDWLIVQGDTTTVLISTLCAFYHGIRVGHIEAGLRTYQKRSPFPEEINRQIVGRIADIHFAPTRQSVENLEREGVPRETIFLTGNTGIDSLLFMDQKVNNEIGLLSPQVTSLLESEYRMILVTGHRRENFGDKLKNICQAMIELTEKYNDIFFLYPVHLNPNTEV
jgi:UDP-N-acetylglucosamine 2-epimerase